jgi:hypothetical protein
MTHKPSVGILSEAHRLDVSKLFNITPLSWPDSDAKGSELTASIIDQQVRWKKGALLL